MYKIFYATEGKWHTRDKITHVATCGNFIVPGENGGIHVEDNPNVAPHPLLCRRCLAKK